MSTLVTRSSRSRSVLRLMPLAVLALGAWLAGPCAGAHGVALGRQLRCRRIALARGAARVA